MSKRAEGAPYRVVQWATGNIGTRSLRNVIEHPRMELVGVYVHSEAKVGRDAGDLAGTGPVGIKATHDIEQILALKADCVLYMQEGVGLDDLCRLLESGANVVTTRTEFHNPKHIDPAMRDRLEEACRRGGSSLHSTGSSPGFSTEALPLVLATLQRRLDFLSIEEFADMSSRDSPGLLFNVMGFGKPLAPFDEAAAAHIRYAFGPSLSVVADALSLPFDSIEAGGEYAVARNRTQIAAGVIEAGTIAGQRLSVTGFRGGKPLMRFRCNWFVTTDLDPAWELRETGWRVQVQGDAPVNAELTFPVTPEQMAATTPGYTAHRAVNLVPYICDAAPGIRTSVDLPQIITTLG